MSDKCEHEWNVYFCHIMYPWECRLPGGKIESVPVDTSFSVCRKCLCVSHRIAPSPSGGVPNAIPGTNKEWEGLR